MTTIIQPRCLTCIHLDREAPGMSCDAFPGGIPDDIVRSQIGHDKPVAGDHGVQFEQDPKMPVLDRAFYESIYSSAKK